MRKRTNVKLLHCCAIHNASIHRRVCRFGIRYCCVPCAMHIHIVRSFVISMIYDGKVRITNELGPKPIVIAFFLLNIPQDEKATLTRSTRSTTNHLQNVYFKLHSAILLTRTTYMDRPSVKHRIWFCSSLFSQSMHSALCLWESVK